MNNKKKCFVIMPFAKAGSPDEQKYLSIQLSQQLRKADVTISANDTSLGEPTL